MADNSEEGHLVPRDHTPGADDQVLVSVIIPAFNRIELLGRAVSSALNQTCVDLEVLVVDDGSKEDVPSALRPFDDKRLRYHRRDANQGISAARNYAASLSRAKYLAFLDSDDEWMPEKIASQLARLSLKGPQYRACYTKVTAIDDTTGKPLFTTDFDKEGDLLSDLLYEPKMTTSSLMLERELLEEVGGFDERIHFGEDWDLYLRLTQHSPFACAPEALTLYHIHDRGRATDNMDRNPLIVRSFSTLFENNQRLFHTDRRAWSRFLVQMGYYQASGGQRRAAMGSFLRAVIHDPLEKSAYLSIARLIKGWKTS